MRPFLWCLVLSTAAILPTLLAIGVSASAIQQASTELDAILHAAHIEFAPLTHTTAYDAARSLVTNTQRARIAIAHHVVTTTPLGQADLAMTLRAQDLQIELMRRVQSHLSTQLDQQTGIEGMEWDLHRGFRDGLYEAEEKQFTKNVLQPYRFAEVEEVAEDVRWTEKLVYMLKRIRAGLRDLNPVAAWRRWKMHRLIEKLSTPPPSSPLPPLSPGLSPVPSNPPPWNLPHLRARLSAITTLKSTQSRSAAADAHDASAAARVENAVIHSDLVLDKLRIEQEAQLQKMQHKKIKHRPSETNGYRAPRTWTYTYNRHVTNHVEDWSKLAELAVPASAR